MSEGAAGGSEPSRRPAPGRLTKTAVAILAYIARHEGEVVTKADIAAELGRHVKTVDRLISGLRAEGLIIAEPRYVENGGQIGNVYRLARKTERQS